MGCEGERKSAVEVTDDTVGGKADESADKGATKLWRRMRQQAML